MPANDSKRAGSSVLAAAFGVLTAVGVGACKSDANDNEDEAKDTRPQMPEACKRPAAPNGTHLGLKPEPFVECLEQVIASMKMPDEAKRGFTKGEDGSYTIPKFMALSMQVEDGFITSIDALYFNELREAHGMGPELGAQYATLAIVFPEAEVDPRKGKTIFDEIDAIGRETNKAVIKLAREGVSLEASFLPISVRYRFTPAPAR